MHGMPYVVARCQPFKKVEIFGNGNGFFRTNQGPDAVSASSVWELELYPISTPADGCPLPQHGAKLTSSGVSLLPKFNFTISLPASRRAARSSAWERSSGVISVKPDMGVRLLCEITSSAGNFTTVVGAQGGCCT